MNNINFIGLEDFDDFEIKVINDLVEGYLPKIRLKNIKLKLQCKKYEKEGKRHHYSFHARLEILEKSILVKDDDWDLKLVLHKVMEKLLNKVQKDFRQEGSKYYKSRK